MNPNLQAQVLRAKTPRDAIVILANAIDSLAERMAALEATPADPWDSWGADANAPAAFAPTATSGDNAAEVAQLQSILAGGRLDAETEQSVSARLRLLLEDGKAVAASVPEGRRERVIVTDDQVVVELPAPSQERQTDRRHFAVATGLHQFIDLPQDATVDAYSKGGPLWLYHYNRDAVMQMPAEWRMAMVNDIQLDSPATAQEVGRDILKYTQADGTRDAAYEAHLNRGD